MTAKIGMTIAEYQKAEQILHDAHIAAGSPNVGFLSCPHLVLGEVIGVGQWPPRETEGLDRSLNST